MNYVISQDKVESTRGRYRPKGQGFPDISASDVALIKWKEASDKKRMTSPLQELAENHLNLLFALFKGGSPRLASASG